MPDYLYRMLNVKYSSLLRHIIGVLICLTLPLIFISSQSSSTSAWSTIRSFEYILFCACYLFIYYCNSLLLIPWLYFKRKYFLYLLSILVLLAGIVYVKPYDKLAKLSRSAPVAAGTDFGMPHEGFDPPPGGEGPGPKDFPGERPQPRPKNFGAKGPGFDIISVFLLILIILVGLSNALIDSGRQTEKRILQAENEKTQAELSFLKAQINPHFLFNTLNNIYSLAVTNSDHTADAIMKLSKIMRYVTDEVNEEKVPLENEIECIEDYISLQKLRLGSKVAILFDVKGNPFNKSIPPLLLMTFFENAFKHGISNHEETSISCSIDISATKIIFNITNKLFDKPRSLERRGIGIANIKERLNLLYPGKHALNIINSNGSFTVNLELIS